MLMTYGRPCKPQNEAKGEGEQRRWFQRFWSGPCCSGHAPTLVQSMSQCLFGFLGFRPAHLNVEAASRQVCAHQEASIAGFEGSKRLRTVFGRLGATQHDTGVAVALFALILVLPAAATCNPGIVAKHT